MNLFYLHKNPITAAQMHCDQHVVKMLVETAQMLSTAHRVLDGEKTKRPSVSGKRMVDYYVHPDPILEHTLYKAVHFKHCLLYTSPSPRDRTRSRMPSSA